MRRMLSLAAVLALAGGFGASAVGSHARADAEPVVPVDRPAPEWIDAMLHPPAPASGGASQVCLYTFGWGSGGTSTTSGPNCSPTPEQQARLEAEQRRRLAALQPVAGSESRTVAVLSLANGGTASFAAWQTASGPCWAVGVESGGGGGGGSPDGPCTRMGETSSLQPPCGVLCLSSSGGGGSEDSMSDVLSGTVPRDAEAARVTLADGSTETVPLDGPVLPQSGDRRIFMLELGSADSWRKVELLTGGAVTATLAMPPEQAAFEDCTAKLGRPPRFQPSPGLDQATMQQELQRAMAPYEEKLNACIRSRR